MTGYVGGDPYQSPTFGKALSLRVDGGVNAISINPSGRDVVLASRQGLHIIDLDDPFSPPRWLRHVTPWQVADVQWSPHPAKPFWVVSTSNQKAIIWNLARSSNKAIEHVLHKHFRAITDINFSYLHPDILATCSIDTYVHAWDMRSPKRPFYTTRDWRSGASQVKWNYHDQNILASAHGNDVTIWDLRKGSEPLGKLVGHGSSVNSIDFNRFKKKSEIMTGSNDGTVKFWDYSVSCTLAKKTIKADFPVWRGRYLPFGEGCCIMPTVGGNNYVYLANLSQPEAEEKMSSKLQTIYAFKGHTDPVTDFVWRSRHSYDNSVDDREFQLVTWSKDCDLRLWPVPDFVFEKVNFERNRRLNEKLHNYEYVSYNREINDESSEEQKDHFKRIKETFVSTSGLKKSDDLNHITWLSGVRMNHADSPESIFKERIIQNLGEEVSLIGHKFPKIVFEKISVSTGELIVTLNAPASEETADEYVFLRIHVKFAAGYPSKANSPIFSIEDNGNLSPERRLEILKNLRLVSQKYTDSGLYCLEPCLRLLLGEKVNLDDINDDEPLINFEIDDLEGLSSLPSSESNSHYSSETSTDSETEDYKKDVLASRQLQKGPISEKDPAFDSTPVPNECGAVWSSKGQLFCFFVSESNQDKKQAILRLTGRDNVKQNKNRNKYPKLLVDSEHLVENDTESRTTRPKTYLETIIHTTSTQGNSRCSSDDESFSYNSDESFDEDWSDILRNEVVVRTKLPALHAGNFAKKFGSAYSGSAKTVDSAKEHKNVMFSKDFSFLIPESRDLALKYQLIDSDGDLEKLSRNNALIAEEFGMEEISHCWQILSDLLMTNKNENPYNLVWDNHPMSIKWFVKEAVAYFEKQKNIQMISMICCIVANELFGVASKSTDDKEDTGETLESIVTFDMNDPSGSWRNDSHSQYSGSMNLSYSGPLKKNRQSPDAISVKSEDYFSARHYNYTGRISSLSPPISSTVQLPKSHLYHSRIPDVSVQLVHDDVLEALEDPVRHLLDSEDAENFRRYSYQYAKLLFRWGLPIQRVEMIKVSALTKQNDTEKPLSLFVPDSEDSFGGLTIKWINDDKENVCFQHCNYCGLKVTRNIFVCQQCEHVMHAACAKEWWKHSDECASGCGCHCLI